MKTYTITLGIVCTAAVVGAIICLKEKAPRPAAIVATPPPQPAPAKDIVIPEPDQSPPIPARPRTTASSETSARTAPVVSAAKPGVYHSRAVDTLVGAQTGMDGRWTLLRQLKKAGELDAAVAELKQRAAEDPTDGAIQIALGEALMSKFPIQDYNESAMLGLQINQSFEAALKLDPANWEAQYSKADALSYWPAEMNAGPEVIKQLTGLIDQQETMTQQSQFVNSYVLLGEEYQKLGQPEKAAAAWQLGLQKFPNNPALLSRGASLANQ